jgi:hypothetical protein
LNIDELHGLWRRDWLRAEGVDDSTTRVFWGQSGTHFVDVRAPLERPNLKGMKCFAELDASCLLRLMESEGFAGNIDLTADICTWHREINWHGHTQSIHAGRLWFSEQSDILIEDGIHGQYREQWRKQPAQMFTAKNITLQALSGVLLISDSLFLLGIGDERAESSEKLKRSLSNDIIPTEAKAYFASEYCIGHWDGKSGVVELSTNPFHQGHPVLDKSGDSITWLQQASDGSEQAHKL